MSVNYWTTSDVNKAANTDISFKEACGCKCQSLGQGYNHQGQRQGLIASTAKANATISEIRVKTNFVPFALKLAPD